MAISSYYLLDLMYFIQENESVSKLMIIKLYDEIRNLYEEKQQIYMREYPYNIYDTERAEEIQEQIDAYMKLIEAIVTKEDIIDG